MQGQGGRWAEDRAFGRALELAKAGPGSLPVSLGTARARLPTAVATRHTAPIAVPDIRYARSGDVSIAYQVVGDGARDLVLVHGWVCTFQPGWENERIARFYRRLASFGRLILFDKRGTGLSDRVANDRLPDLETRMDDVRAVMDAAGSERATLVGVSEGGPLSILFAATYPERAEALVLLGSFARLLQAPDYPIGVPDDVYRGRVAALEADDWLTAATNEWLTRVAPSVASDPEEVRWYRSYVAKGASPAAALALREMNRQIDVRDVLPAVAVPTLVAYRAGEAYGERSAYLAEHIAGAVESVVPGDDHLPWEGDQRALLDAIGRFLADVEGEAEPNRVLATVLFTDLVGSTAKAVELGDREWRRLLDRHYELVRAHLARFRGREVDTTGDGVFALFDGPARAIRCAGALARAVRGIGLELRAGLHTGEIELEDGRPTGVAVHIGARVMALAGAGEVLVSSTVKDIVAGSGIGFAAWGSAELKGVPGEWALFRVESP